MEKDKYGTRRDSSDTFAVLRQATVDLKDDIAAPRNIVSDINHSFLRSVQANEIKS